MARNFRVCGTCFFLEMVRNMRNIDLLVTKDAVSMLWLWLLNHSTPYYGSQNTPASPLFAVSTHWPIISHFMTASSSWPAVKSNRNKHELFPTVLPPIGMIGLWVLEVTDMGKSHNRYSRPTYILSAKSSLKCYREFSPWSLWSVGRYVVENGG